MHAAVAVCLGACMGALLRWRLGLWLNHDGSWLPWGTLAANLIGGYLIGLALGVLQQYPHVDPWWRLFVITGLLGALTTFSSFSAEVLEMMALARWLQAFVTMASHVGGSLLLSLAGFGTAVALFTPRA